MLRFVARLVALLSFAVAVAQAQTITQSSPQALTLASQSLQAADGATILTDATLQGTAHYVAGSDEESGTFTLEAGSHGQRLTDRGLVGGNTISHCDIITLST